MWHSNSFGGDIIYAEIVLLQNNDGTVVVNTKDKNVLW